MDALADGLSARVAASQARSRLLPSHPRVYFEEWDEPMISGLGWVSELVEAAGGIDVFPALSRNKNAKDRIVSADIVIVTRPDIIIGSWCGKKFIPSKVAARPGFAQLPAVASGWLREIKSALILQPGPAAPTAKMGPMCKPERPVHAPVKGKPVVLEKRTEAKDWNRCSPPRPAPTT